MTNKPIDDDTSNFDDGTVQVSVTEEIRAYESELRNDTYVENAHDYSFKFDGDAWTERFSKLQTYMVERQMAMFARNVEHHTSKLDDDSVRTMLLKSNKYVTQKIDCAALYQLLIKKKIDHQKAVWMTLRMVSSVILRSRKADTDSRKELTSASKNIGDAIACLEQFATHDCILFFKYFSRDGSNAIETLSCIQMEIMEALNTQFPDGKQNKIHDETIRDIARVWLQNIEKPKIYDGSPFVEAVSICTGEKPETILDILKNMRTDKRI
jgi:hypothetical protein